jgi:hypothetical protein
MDNDFATEHIAGPFTPSHNQRCLRCGITLGLHASVARNLIPIYQDYFGDSGRFTPYEPVWIFDGAIWPVSPDPEKVKIIFCGSSH